MWQLSGQGLLVAPFKEVEVLNWLKCAVSPPGGQFLPQCNTPGSEVGQTSDVATLDQGLWAGAVLLKRLWYLIYHFVQFQLQEQSYLSLGK